MEVSAESWPNHPLAGFDLETTAPIPTEARIVTANITVRRGEEVMSQDWLADPGAEIPAEATGIHGITTEHAREQGRPIAEVVVEVAEQIAEVWSENLPIIVYNSPYDLTVLHHELIRHHDPRGLLAFGPIGHVIDPLVIDKAVDKYRPGSRKLKDTCKHYGIELSEAHSAAADTLAAMRLAWKLGTRYPRVGARTLPELQADQREWYCEQQTSFAAYLREKIMPTVELGERWALQEKIDGIEAGAGRWPIRIGVRP